jgi:Cu(I)-responsive transcriptional regulator
MEKQKQDMNIGRLARAVGVSTDTIRFYERRGLLAPPSRSEANYRIYPQSDVRRLKFILRAKALGFTLNEIKELLGLHHNPTATKAEVKALTEEKIEDIRQRITDLGRILRILEDLAETCDGHGPADDCPILAALEGEDPGHNPEAAATGGDCPGSAVI